MNVFISWSGSRSHTAALALRDWLPLVFRGCVFFVSSEDIERGERWGERLDQELAGTDVGIVCVTPENLESRWLMYEAGALSKAVDKARVVVLTFGCEPTDVDYPLARFMGTTVREESDALKLCQSLNARLSDSFEGPHLEAVVRALWPQLKLALAGIPDDAPPDAVPAPPPSDGKLLHELVGAVRDLQQRLSDSEANRPTFPPPTIQPVVVWPAETRETSGQPISSE